MTLLSVIVLNEGSTNSKFELAKRLPWPLLSETKLSQRKPRCMYHFASYTIVEQIVLALSSDTSPQHTLQILDSQISGECFMYAHGSKGATSDNDTF